MPNKTILCFQKVLLKVGKQLTGEDVEDIKFLMEKPGSSVFSELDSVKNGRELMARLRKRDDFSLFLLVELLEGIGRNDLANRLKDFPDNTKEYLAGQRTLRSTVEDYHILGNISNAIPSLPSYAEMRETTRAGIDGVDFNKGTGAILVVFFLLVGLVGVANMLRYLDRVSHPVLPCDSPGTYRCNRKKCYTCPHVSDETRISAPLETFDVLSRFTCISWNIIYIIRCTNCNILYVGSTSRRLGDRFVEHLRSVKNNTLGLPVARHFNHPSPCNLSHFTVCGARYVVGNNHDRIAAEHSLISELGTMHPRGLNSS